MKKTIQVISFLLLCLYVIAVGFLCLMRPEDLPSAPLDIFGIPIDKVAHFTMFFPFPILAWFSNDLDRMGHRRKAVVLLLILFIGATMAFGTELLQKMTEYRTFDLKDFYADMIGMGLSWIIVVTSVFVGKSRKIKKQ